MALIKDPIRTDLNLAEALAEQSPLGLGTAYEEFKNIMPGGDTFRPDIMTQSIQDFFLRKMPDSDSGVRKFFHQVGLVCLLECVCVCVVCVCLHSSDGAQGCASTAEHVW